MKSNKRLFIEAWADLPDNYNETHHTSKEEIWDRMEKELLQAIEKDSQPSPEDKPASDPLKEHGIEKIKAERNDYLSVLRSGLKNYPTLNQPFTEEIEEVLKKYKKL